MTVEEQLRQMAADRIATLRGGISEAARRSGITQPHISQWLSGTKGMSLATMQRLMDGLGLDVRVQDDNSEA